MVTIARLTGADSLGRPTDAAWTGITRTTLRDARSGSAPVHKTVVQFAELHDVLWVRFECEATSIRATMTRYKDKVWTEGAVEVYLRPTRDGPLYEFQLSPIGTCRDLRVHDPGGPQQSYDDSWSCEGLQTDARIHRNDRGEVRGWSAVFGIPLSSVGRWLGGELERSWKLGAFRLEYDPEEFSALRSHPTRDAHSSDFLCAARLDPPRDPPR